MSIAVKRGRFTANTATGNQAVTGVGFQPKAVILLSARVTAVGYAGSALTAVGLAASATQRQAIASNIRNVAGAAGGSQNHHADRALKLRSNLDGDSGAADLVSMNADGFTLNWTTAPQGAYLIEYLALGGAGLQTSVGRVDHPQSTTSAQTLTGLGFAPEALMLMSSGSNVVPSGSGASDADGQLGFGFACRDGSRATVAHYLHNLTSPQDVGSFTSSAEALAAFNARNPAGGAAGALDLELYVDSFGADGWTAHSGSAMTRDVYYHYLALAGVSAKVVTATQPSSTGNQAITGVGFQPRAVIALSAQEATGDDAASTPNTSRNLRRVLGVADAASGSCIWASAQDALVNNTDADSGQHDELMRFSDNAQAKLAGATVASLDSDGLTLNWNQADASGRKFRLLLIGDPPAQSVTAAAIASAEAVGSPTVTLGPLADSIDSAEAFGAPTVTPGPVTAVADSVNGGEAFGEPTVAHVFAPLAPIAAASIASAEAVGKPRVGEPPPDADESPVMLL